MDVEVLTALVIGFITVVLLFFIFGRSGSKRPNILITGLCDSGKTLMFTQLTRQAFKLTHTSLQENEGTVRIKDKDVAMVDIPGHERLREKMTDQYTCTARALIFAVDSSTVTKDIKDVAEYLYLLLTDPQIAKKRVPVLIACNKQDVAFTKSSKVIKSLLEKELTTVRKTRSAGLEGTDGTTAQRCQLGKDDADFDFSQLVPQKVEVIECSARGASAAGDAPELDDVKQWLQTV